MDNVMDMLKPLTSRFRHEPEQKPDAKAEIKLPKPKPLPQIDAVYPAAALPGGEITLEGSSIGPTFSLAASLPIVTIDSHIAPLRMSRPTRVTALVPEEASTGPVTVTNAEGTSNGVPLRVARQLSDGLHPVTSPAVSASGMIYATISGPRGRQTPVSVVRISPEGHPTPFLTEIMNATGLAFNPDDTLFVSSRAEGTIYRIDAGGEAEPYVESMGTATGIVFDRDGSLFVGDRSGTIFKISPDKQIFVHATLEPSISAYHLALAADGTLFVTGPTLGLYDNVWAIAPDGGVKPWFKGLGRPQGLALDADNNLYVTASYKGQRGLVRIDADGGNAELAVAGPNLVGVAFSPLGTTVLATHRAVYDVDLGVEGLRLF